MRAWGGRLRCVLVIVLMVVGRGGDVNGLVSWGQERREWGRLVGTAAPLCLGLYDDAAPALDFDVQVVLIQQHHAHKGRGIDHVGVHVSWLTVP